MSWTGVQKEAMRTEIVRQNSALPKGRRQIYKSHLTNTGISHFVREKNVIRTRYITIPNTAYRKPLSRYLQRPTTTRFVSIGRHPFIQNEAFMSTMGIQIAFSIIVLTFSLVLLLSLLFSILSIYGSSKHTDFDGESLRQ